jgi:hypothetical protein
VSNIEVPNNAAVRRVSAELPNAANSPATLNVQRTNLTDPAGGEPSIRPVEPALQTAPAPFVANPLRLQALPQLADERSNPLR